jgi:3-dehydroquinate synthase
MPASFPTLPKEIQTVHVSLAERSYPILIGSSLLQLPAVYRALPDAAKVMVVTNDLVGPLYLSRISETLERRYSKVLTLQIPDGELHKRWETLNRIHDALLQNACDRRTIIFALGGGVVGDLAGFAAATYMRGVPYVQIPTTLLAQVDSSVGGKTAINHPLGKNMVGAFHQPLMVVCDTDTLATLPRRELSAGMAEVIKYGPIFDMQFLEWIELNLERLLGGDPIALGQAIRRSCEIKALVVGADEREAGQRAILNFGHTFGHAIEAGLGFGQWLHGEAVGCGMVMAACLSRRLGLVDEGFVERLTRLIAGAGLPTVGPDLGVDRYLALMRVDKKAEAGEIRFVLIEGPGNAVLRVAPDDLVADVLRHCCARQPAATALCRTDGA